MRARQVERVVGDVEQRDRAPDVRQRGGRPALDVVQARDRPVEPDPRVGVGRPFGLGDRVLQHPLGALEVAEIRQGVAEVRGEANLCGEIIRRLTGDLVEAALEEIDRPLSVPARRECPAERRVDVGANAWRDVRQLEPRLEPLDRVVVVPGVRGREPERDARARGGEGVPGFDRILQKAVELALGVGGVVREAQLQLGVGDPQLALLGVPDLGAGLEVVGRNAQLAREHPQRLDGRAPRPAFDPGDVGVRHPRGSELALRKAAFVPEPLQPLADRLLGRVSMSVRHRLHIDHAEGHRQSPTEP